MPSNYHITLNTALEELAKTKNITSAISVCNTLLVYMGIETRSIEDIELSKLKLPNAERYDRWFDAHPHFRGDRACFELTNRDAPILEAKLYAIKKRSKLFIAGAVNFTPNFEDRDYTRNDPSMKVGIDFFLPPEKDAVIVVLSNKGILRLVELSGRLTNTQRDIFALWQDVARIDDKNRLHTTLWESFKLSSLNKKFYEGISNSFLTLTQYLQKNGTEVQLANQFANRLHGRILFLWFLRKKGIINEAKEYFTLEDQTDAEYYTNTLSTLFFNILNNEDHKEIDPVTPYLNGGLFDQKSDGMYWNTNTPIFPIGFFRTLYDHFDAFNFTTDESTPEYEQIAIDPEMLGRIFESFLATLTTETGEQAKKANGAFYTPREIVSYMSSESLRQYLYTALDASTTLRSSIDNLLDRPNSDWALSGTNSIRDTVSSDDRKRILDSLKDIRVLDPAVGSGAFPMGVLHKILSLCERLDPSFDSYTTKLAILQNNIYGVDIDPTAIEICRLRAWLSIIVDVRDLKKIKPLPNLEFKFVCANSLIGLDGSKQTSLDHDLWLKNELIRIRDEYYATSSKKLKEKRQKEYLDLTHPKQNGIFDTAETRQLKSYQPFTNGVSSSFYDPELMHGVADFDVVIGNPPYVQLQKLARTQIQKDLENAGYKTFAKTGDLYCLFYERGLELSKKETGVLSYITSNKWMRAGYGEKLRQYISTKSPLVLIDLGPWIFESATVDTNILIVKNETGHWSIDEEWKPQGHGAFCQKSLTLKVSDRDNIVGAVRDRWVFLPWLSSGPWFIGSTAELDLKTKIEKIGTPLKDWDVKISRWIITWLNEAFIIDRAIRDRLIVEDPKSMEIIKPILRGRDIQRYGYEFAEQYLIVVKYCFAKELSNYPAIFKHLETYEMKLRERGQCNTSRSGKEVIGKKWDTWQHHWLELDNNPSDEYLMQFEKEKVVWQEMSSEPCFAYDNDGIFCNDTGRILTGNNIKFFIGLFNSHFFQFTFTRYYAGWWLGEKGIRYKSEFMKDYPIPSITSVNQAIIQKIETLVDLILSSKKLDPQNGTSDLEKQIDKLVYELYDLTVEEIGIVEGNS